MRSDEDYSDEATGSRAARLKGMAEGLGSKLSFTQKGKRGGRLRPEDRLSSVVSESEQGSTMSMLRENGSFSVAGGEGSVILVLPTQDEEFGGLSSKQANSEDKGMIINLINADDINAVVTQELLDDDALGLIPNASSLERMGEFSLLRGARYVYGVVIEDYDTGALAVFSVPPVDPESGRGLLFDEVSAVSAGERSVSEVVDQNLIRAMIAIYRDPELGREAVDRAIEANLDLVVRRTLAGAYPSGAELVSNLLDLFPSIGSVVDRPSEVIEQQEAEAVEAGRHRADDAAEGTEDVPEESGVRFGGAEDDSDAPTSVLQALVGGGDETEADDAQEQPVFGESGGASAFDDDDEAEPVFEPAAPEPAAAPAVEFPALREQFDALGSELRETITGLLSGAVGNDGVVGEFGPEIEVDPQAEFGYGQVVESAGRQYLNDDLGLRVDGEPFYARLTSKCPEITLAEDSKRTPWLDGQVNALLTGLNDKMAALHQDNQNKLKQHYFGLADRVVAEVKRDFDPTNPDSVVAGPWEAIQRDKERLTSNHAKMASEKEKEVRQEWAARKTQFVEDAAARARNDFEHRYAARIDGDVKESTAEVLSLVESQVASAIADFNDRRRTAARDALDEKLSNILLELEPLAQEQAESEAELLEAGLESLTNYIDQHRKEDLHQADVSERMLAADNRVEQILAETQVRIEAMQRDTSAAIESKNRQLEAQEMDHRRQFELHQETTQLTIAQYEERAARAQRELADREAAHQQEVQNISDSAARQVDAAERAYDQAVRDKNNAIKGSKRDYTLLFMIVGLAVVCAAILGAIVGSTLL